MDNEKKKRLIQRGQGYELVGDKPFGHLQAWPKI